MTKLDGKSLDIKEQNIESLKELFPEVFSEGKIDFEKLQEELGAFTDKENERYNFTWNGKQEAKRIAQTPSTGTLRPCKEESKNWDTTQNLYIEGDNLEVLKLLQKSYHKKVKMIYIDPPYNTGKDFVYKDNFRDNIKNYMEQTGQIDSDGNRLSTNSDTNGRYHSDWLSMMYPRLKLARNLLKDDGVIFISIDDNEVANLRKLCDEIFGEDNFVANIIWQKRTSPDVRTVLSTAHDYILVYTKKYSLAIEKFNTLPLTEKQRKQYKNFDNDPRGSWASSDFSAQGYRPNQMYKITTPNGVEYYPPESRCWKNTENVFKKQLEEGRFWFGKDGKGVPRWKTYLSEVEGRVPWTWWTNDEVGHSQTATQEVKALFNEQKFFDYPKPILLIKRCLQMTTLKDDLILDFFSGSATLADSIMQLNSEDNGNRKYICIQLPENIDEKSEVYKAGYKNICEIGKERIRRAGEKIIADNPDKDLSNLDIGFKVYKLDSSNIKEWDSDFDNLETNLLDAVDNIKADRTSEDLLYEILLKYGLDLTLPIEELILEGKTVYNIGYGALVVCLDDNITITVVEAIAEFIKEQVVYDKEKKKRHARVVFKDKSFADTNVKTNAIQVLKQFDIDEVVSI